MTDVEILAVGAGPANLALAVALEELAPELAATTLLVEQADDVEWQPGMLLPWARSQVSFLKDLVTLRNPRSRFTFLNYLHESGRLDAFVNLSTFTPYRIEISEYLAWVARSLELVRVDCGRRSTAVAPERRGTDITGWRVDFADGSTVTCRQLVMGTGRDPYVPEVFRALPAHRVTHSTAFRDRLDELDPRLPRRIVVVGAAQSAVELLWASHERLPRARCTLVMRSAALRSYEHSKFANESYYPSYVEEFFAASPEARRQLLDDLAQTNYGAADPDLLDTVYERMYLDRLTGTARTSVRTATDVVACRMEDDDVVLTLTDRRSGEHDEIRCDQVLLGTGFAKQPPSLVQQLAKSANLDEITVDRSYRLTVPDATAPVSCHLQGVNESTHGISDSLLSVVATRAEDIVADIRRLRARAAG